MRKEHWIISTLKCLGFDIEHRFTGKGSRGGKQEEMRKEHWIISTLKCLELMIH